MPTRPEPDAAAVLTLRRRSQRLEEPAADPVSAVGALLAMQAQDHAGSLWSVGRRTVRRDRTAVEAALSAGSLVRSWPMRGTLHLIRADDLRPLLALTRDRAVAAAAGLHRRAGLEPGDVERAASLAREALAPGPLPRRGLLDAIAAGGVDVSGQRGAHLVVRLAQDGVIVLVGHREAAAAEGLLPASAAPWVIEPGDPDARIVGLGWLARRYLAGHGPASVRDLAWWAGITLTDARAGVAAIREELESTVLAGEELLAPAGLEADARPHPVDALSGFDEWLLGYADRSAPLGPHPLERLVPGANGLFLPTVTIDGRIAATWRRERGPGRAEGETVVLDPWHPIAARRMPAVRRAFRDRLRFDGVALAGLDTGEGSGG